MRIRNSLLIASAVAIVAVALAGQAAGAGTKRGALGVRAASLTQDGQQLVFT